MDLGLGLRGRDVKVTWAVCDVDGFVAYRIIRSTDALVTYPRAEGDTLVAEIEDAGRNHFVDENAPAGKRLWYAVFGIARSDGESYVACASAVESIATPAAPEPTKTPAPKETSAPAEPASLGLALVLHEGHPSLDWTPCVVDGADAYKVVRSTDSTVRWPLGEHDTLVKVVGMDGTTAFVDGDAPAGTRVWYRVFCIRHVGDGYQVVAASPAKSIETPNPEPSPEPQALSLEIASEGGYAVLHWETCTADPFSHYRIVRTASEGPSVVKEIESRSTTSWTDETVVVGETYHFTVQCKGHVGNSYPLLGTSDPVAVTIE